MRPLPFVIALVLDTATRNVGGYVDDEFLALVRDIDEPAGPWDQWFDICNHLSRRREFSIDVQMVAGSRRGRIFA